MPRLTSDDVHLWNEGTYFQSYDRLGAHPNQRGTWFTVWAPHADRVSVIGDFNDWDPAADALDRRDAGLWETYVRGARPGERYKFRVENGTFSADKTDPYAFRMEPPAKGSENDGLAAIVTDLDDYTWQDDDWMAQREGPEGLNQPMSVYEVHLGSWMKKGGHESLSYREIAEPLAEHALEMGFTHVEFLPLAEHPYYGSWGYQIVGYYAPTFRYGTPQDLMYLVDYLHQRGLGVIMDWVPGHFATDPQGLSNFDGTPLFEYEDPVMQRHPDWGTYVFDFAKEGVQNFLISNALFWLDRYHIDGLRVDAVASMLYRDYSREAGEWTPNEHGGRENLEAVRLLQTTNEAVYEHFPQAVTVAEESTAWPGVTRPTSAGGLGFLYKWNLGWMNDTLAYLKKDPVHRKYHHNDVTFSLMYAFSEQYALPLSHDEVVHMKGSLWGKMAGDDWQKAANLRLLYAHQTGHPGKKLLFMGDEFGQRREWNHDAALDWGLAEDDPFHAGLMRWTRDVNRLYQDEPALWSDFPGTFEWVDADDYERSVLSYLRTGEDGETLLFVLNMTPEPREKYRVGVPAAGAGRWRELLNSDAEYYGGSGTGNYGGVDVEAQAAHGHDQSLALTLPPLGALVLKPEEAA